jgi:plastocyanin
MDTVTTVAPPKTTTRTWLRLARGAAITMVIWAVVLQSTAGTIIPPVAVIGLAYLVLARFSAGERPKLGLGIAVFSAVAVLGNLPILIDELQHPESAPAFVLTLLSTLGAVVAFIAGLGAYRRWPTGSTRLIPIGAVAVFVVGAAISFVVASNTESDTARASDVAVVAERLSWEPVDVRLPASASGVWVDNRDGIRHTFTVPALGIDLAIPALKSRRVDISAAPGVYELICLVPGHESMTGTLVVGG